MLEWSQEALLRRFSMPADWVPATAADSDAFEARCVDLLRDPANNSGFKEVYPCKGTKPWQAKVYVGPKKQRQLGRFNTELEAAKAIVWWWISGDKLKSPKKERNKRGEGRRKRDRRKGACCLSSEVASPAHMTNAARLHARRSFSSSQDYGYEEDTPRAFSRCGQSRGGSANADSHSACG